jgi:putative endonuclease
MKKPAVYIVTNKPHGTIYTGVTKQLIKRVHEHKTHVVKGFTDKYNATRLVHYELYEDIKQAIQREKNIKHWLREWKIALIEKNNPDWRDLWDEIIG